MRIQSVGELVSRSVRRRIGITGAAQEVQVQNAVEDFMAVFAIVQESDSVAAIRNVDPLVAADLVLGHVPGGVPMGWPLDVAELDLAAGGGGADGGGEA